MISGRTACSAARTSSGCECCFARPASATPTTAPRGAVSRAVRPLAAHRPAGARRCGAVLSSRLDLSSYLLPWLVWATAALGLNLLMGWAGQFHLGYAAIMGIGAYAAVHAARAGMPFEFALMARRACQRR